MSSVVVLERSAVSGMRDALHHVTHASIRGPRDGCEGPHASHRHIADDEVERSSIDWLRPLEAES